MVSYAGNEVDIQPTVPNRSIDCDIAAQSLVSFNLKHLGCENRKLMESLSLGSTSAMVMMNVVDCFVEQLLNVPTLRTFM